MLGNNNNIKVNREPHLAEKIVFVDGLGGCGKTMLSPILSSFERVELLTYAYEIEHICSLYYLKKIEKDAAVAMVRMLTDLQLYKTMMSREINFRPGDLSSVFRDTKPLRYFLRLFREGDEAIPARVAKEKPILHLTTHNLLAFSEPIFSALEKRGMFIQLVRHPLYMIKQNTVNMASVVGDVRDFSIYYQYKKNPMIYYFLDKEDLFLAANPVEKAIYYLEKLTEMTEILKKGLHNNLSDQILTIPFELFVVDPWPYIRKIEELLETKMTSLTNKIMEQQKVPRKMYADGIGLKIYKRFGWESSKTSSEEEEFLLRRQYVAERVSEKAMKVLDRLSIDYEEKYLGGQKHYR